jgi:hypothetical protein
MQKHRGPEVTNTLLNFCQKIKHFLEQTVVGKKLVIICSSVSSYLLLSLFVATVVVVVVKVFPLWTSFVPRVNVRGPLLICLITIVG